MPEPFLRTNPRNAFYSVPVTRLQGEGLSLLSCGAGEAFTSGINTQLLGSTRAQLVLRQHSQHRLAHNLFRPALQQRADRHFLQSARPAAVMTIKLLIDLVARQLYFLPLYHFYIIFAIQMRRVRRLVLPNQQTRNPRRQPPQHHSLGVYHEPVLPYHQLFGLAASWNIRRHLSSHTFPSKDKQRV